MEVIFSFCFPEFRSKERRPPIDGNNLCNRSGIHSFGWIKAFVFAVLHNLTGHDASQKHHGEQLDCREFGSTHQVSTSRVKNWVKIAIGAYDKELNFDSTSFLSRQ